MTLKAITTEVHIQGTFHRMWLKIKDILNVASRRPLLSETLPSTKGMRKHNNFITYTIANILAVFSSVFVLRCEQQS